MYYAQWEDEQYFYEAFDIKPIQSIGIILYLFFLDQQVAIAL